MHLILQSYAKINISLRVTSKRPDNYHELISLFYKIPSGESIIIKADENLTSDEIFSNINIAGENIIIKALKLFRALNPKIPFMHADLFKTITPGSGLGAGSGNAGAVISWLNSQYDIKNSDVPKLTGADVPFMSCNYKSAIVSGIGDKLEKIDLPEIHGLVIIPDWPAETGNAYNALDMAFAGKYELNEIQAREELSDIIKKLRSHEFIGLLPNDFGRVLFKRSEYLKLFELLKNSGAYAYGLTGSGSALFGLFHEHKKISWPDYVSKVLYF